VANLQVKNFPDDLHEQLRRRAGDEHLSVSALITTILARELSVPTVDEWLSDVRKLPRHRGVDIEALMDEVRGREPETHARTRGA
jgi:plasmid stability protein